MLDENQELVMMMRSSQKAASIPRNYYCSWTIELNPKLAYNLRIKRGYLRTLETISLEVKGVYNTILVIDKELASSSPDIEWAQWQL